MRSKSDDPVADTLQDACHRIVAAVAKTGLSDAVVLIDGRSGAGKSSLSRLLEDAWPFPEPPQRVELDWIYPGWGGLAEGAERARRGILEPLRRGESGCWHGWDWERNVDLLEEHTVAPGRGLILEGCGVLTRASAPLADVGVWVDAPAATRKERALVRDGDGFRPHWDRWATQEDVHIAKHDPAMLASIVVDIV